MSTISKRVSRMSHGRPLKTAASALVIAILLAGCSTRDNTTTGSVPKGLSNKPIAAMTATELARAADSWGREYQKKPKNKSVGLNYAQTLRMTGRTDQALAVMRQMVIFHPEDNAVLAAYGKAQADAGDLKAALISIRRAQRPDTPDWKLISAEGAILDQLGEAQTARGLYRKALDLKPGDPGVTSNLGMSYLLEGDMKTAETYLRQAMKQPGADSRVRQNLALIVGLQGRFEEAERIARAELSPEQAAQNIAYLRGTLKQQNSWAKLKDKS